jgi:hypothetical protein
MKSILLAGLLALGVGLAMAAPASAAPISGNSTAATTHSLAEPVYYGCRRVRVCNWHHGYRRCYWRRVCRRW